MLPISNWELVLVLATFSHWQHLQVFELESGIGDLRILCGKSYRVSRPLTPDPYLLTLTSRRKCQPIIKRDSLAVLRLSRHYCHRNPLSSPEGGD
jgi:hypothetical protein